MSVQSDSEVSESRFAALRRRWARRPARVLGMPDETGHIEMALSDMQPGEFGHILSICSECGVRQHLLEMGFTPGTEIRFVRIAPLGDPLTVLLRGYQLSLRRREADAVWVRRCPPEIDEDGRGA